MAFELGPNQKAWVEALKSDKFEQGCGVLCSNFDGVKHCCLGVYCEVLISNNIDIKKKVYIYNEDDDFELYPYTEQDANIVYEFNNERDEEVVPESLVKIMGLFSSDGHIEHNEFSTDEFNYSSLTDANDKGCSFKEIAEFIEKYPETVFTKSI